MKSKKGWKILLGIVGGIVVLLILLSVLVKVVFTKEKLLALMVPKIEAALDRKVEVDDVGVSIWGGLGADVKGMTVFNRPGFAQPALFRFDELSIRVKFWPLLRRRIEISKLILENPEINLETTSQGVSNFEDIVHGEGGAIIIPVSFDQLEIDNGLITYLDDKNQSTVVLRKFEQKASLSLDQKGENAELSGKITIPQIELSLPSYKGEFPPLTFSLDYLVNLDMLQQVLQVKDLKLRIAEVQMAVKGEVSGLDKSPALNLTVQSDKIPLGEVLASVPKEQSSPLNQLSTSGNMTVTASVKGRMGEGAAPEIEGKVTLENARIDFAQVPQPFVMPYGEINFNNRSLSFFSSGAQLGGTPMQVKLVLEDFSDLRLSSEISAKPNLAMVQEFVSLPQGMSLAGAADLNLKAYGKLKEPDKMALSGRFGLQKAEIASPGLGVPIRNLDADMALKDGNVEISQMSLSMGKSSMNLQGRLYAVVPYLLSQRKEPPLLSFSFSSPFMDFDEILPESKSAEVGAQAQKSERAASDSILLPGINASGQVSIQQGKFRGVEFTDFSSKVEVSNGVLKLENITSDIYTGKVGGAVETDLRQPDHIKFDMNLTANQIEANDFLSRFTAVDDRLFGKLNLSATFAGEGNSVQDIRKTLLAKGTASFTDGKLVNLPLLDSLSSFVGIPIAREEPIRTLWNTFRIENGRVYFDDLTASSKDGDIQLAGWLGLDGSLDYKLTLVLSPELSTRFSGLGNLANYIKNDEGRVVLDINIGGRTTRPNFSFDTSRAERKLQDQLKATVNEKKEELKDQAKETAQDLLQQLLKKKKK
jgi:uncharacterized protein involved in outer membrane biogenesis